MSLDVKKLKTKLGNIVKDHDELGRLLSLNSVFDDLDALAADRDAILESKNKWLKLYGERTIELERLEEKHERLREVIQKALDLHKHGFFPGEWPVEARKVLEDE